MTFLAGLLLSPAFSSVGRLLAALLLFAVLAGLVVVLRRRPASRAASTGPDDPLMGVTLMLSMVFVPVVGLLDAPVWVRVVAAAVAALVVATPLLITVRKRGRERSI